MQEKRVPESELIERLHQCMAGERVVIESDGKRYSARIQHVGMTGLKVIPEMALDHSHGDPGDVQGHHVAYDSVVELEFKDVHYRL
ncbi:MULTISPECIES: hypothetical protein [Halomonadaceae]|uniref:hypothetical protein n=1 Tax=Halomonadaceae TaxID=28256 RepID=UPI001597DB96|nr:MULTISPECIES: hypothetical protein [Halomonas]QJQ96687.1 hypothetical protein HIO72_16315 [Halomonas sp. PA5]